jgi:hypothetical protein
MLPINAYGANRLLHSAVWLQNWHMSVIEWKQASVAGVKLRRFTGHVGGIEVGSVDFDGSNRLWTWSSPFAEDVWGHAPTQAGAQQALETWLRGWLERLRPVMDEPPFEPGR